MQVYGWRTESWTGFGFVVIYFGGNGGSALENDQLCLSFSNQKLSQWIFLSKVLIAGRLDDVISFQINC